jgi:hypothetical protein
MKTPPDRVRIPRIPRGSQNGHRGPCPRGRPRSPEQSELTRALIRRADAQSRRTARLIREFLDTHVPLDGVTRAWARIHHELRDQLERLPARAAGSPAFAAPAVQQFLAEYVRGVLAELGDPPPADAALPPEPTPEPSPRVRRSSSWAAARAQAAMLGARLLDLRERVVPLPPGWPRGSRDGGRP